MRVVATLLFEQQSRAHRREKLNVRLCSIRSEWEVAWWRWQHRLYIGQGKSSKQSVWISDDMPLVVCVQLDSGRVDKKGINDFAYIIGRSSGAQRGKRIYNIIVLMVAYRHHLPFLSFQPCFQWWRNWSTLFPCQLDRTDGRIYNMDCPLFGGDGRNVLRLHLSIEQLITWKSISSSCQLIM